MSDQPKLAYELFCALTNYPDQVSLMDLAECVVAGKVKLKPPTVTFETTKDFAWSLRNPDRAKYKVLIVAIEKEVIERLESPIILPGKIN